jgi:hypothetical protein
MGSAGACPELFHDCCPLQLRSTLPPPRCAVHTQPVPLNTLHRRAYWWYAPCRQTNCGPTHKRTRTHTTHVSEPQHTSAGHAQATHHNTFLLLWPWSLPCTTCAPTQTRLHTPLLHMLLLWYVFNDGFKCATATATASAHCPPLQPHDTHACGASVLQRSAAAATKPQECSQSGHVY